MTMYLMDGRPITDEDRPILDELKDQEWPRAELTINYDDGWLRFDPGEHLGKELFAFIAQKVMSWKRGEQKFAGPWTPEREDFFREYFGVEMEPDDTDLLQLAYRRAEYYKAWSHSAHKRSAEAHKRFGDIMSYIPLGQPILVGHHSEKRHRRDLANAESSMSRAVDAHKRAEKWDERAAETVRHAAARYGVVKISRRLREIDKLKQEQERFLDAAVAAGRDTTRIERWLAYHNARLEVAYQLLQEAGGNIDDPSNPNNIIAEVGGGVFALGSWYPVIRVNKKTVTVGYWLGVETLTYCMPKDHIKATKSKADWEAVQDRVTAVGGGLKIEEEAK